MENLLSVPSPYEDSSIVSLADWVELTALFSADKNASKEDLKKALQRDGEVSDEVAEEKTDEVFAELRDREFSCGIAPNGLSSYPFVMNKGDTLLSMRGDNITGKAMVYFFLLAVTRSDMSSRVRCQHGPDPTKLFERLCNEVLQNFWGGASAYSGTMIFGTAGLSRTSVRSFRAKIDHLCNTLNEGQGWRDDAIAPGGGDGKLDLVAWRTFSDKRYGSLVAFGQCKTGMHWENHLSELNPKAFSRQFMKEQLVIDPVRLYMVPCRISRHRWEKHTLDGGLLLDRCRIFQYSNILKPTTRSDCKNWLRAVVDAQQKSMTQVRYR